MITRFLRLSRAPFLSASILPILVGGACAFSLNKTFSYTIFILCLIGVASAHAGSNLLNDIFDFLSGVDLHNESRTPFSGGSPDLPQGKEKISTFVLLSGLCFVLAAACLVAVLFLVPGKQLLIVLLAAAGGFLGIAYTAPPLKLAYRGWGEPAIFSAFGILPVSGTVLALTSRLYADCLVAALPVSLLAMMIILINEIPDATSDCEAGKRHWITKTGPKKAALYYDALGLLTGLSIFVMPWITQYDFKVWLGLPGLFFTWRAASYLHQHLDTPEHILPAQAATIIAHAVSGLGLSAGIAL